MVVERLVIEVTERGTKRVSSSLRAIGAGARGASKGVEATSASLSRLVKTSPGVRKAATSVAKVGTAARGAGRQADRMGELFSKATREINRISTGTDKVRRLERAIRDAGVEADRSSGRFRGLRGVLGGLGAAFVARELLQLADAATVLGNRLSVVSDTADQAAMSQQALFELSQRTRSSIEANTELFVRLSLATRELGRSQEEVLGFTESLNQAIKLSGATATEAQAGIIQLSQGISSGALRGDELRSVLEQLPAVADVIATRLGVTRGALRGLGQDGRITADVILDAFKDAREELADRFGATVPTVAEGVVQLKNSAILLVGAFNNLIGVSGGVIAALEGIGRAFDATARVFDSLSAENLNRFLDILLLGQREAIQRQIDLELAIEGSNREIRLNALAQEEATRKARADIDTRRDLTEQLKAEADQRERIKELIQTNAAPTISGTVGLAPLGRLFEDEPIDTSDLDLIATDFENVFLDIVNTARDNTGALLESITNDTETAAGAFDELGLGIQAAFKGIDVSIQSLGVTIGESFLGAIDSASIALADFAVDGLRDAEQLQQGFSDLFRDLSREILAATIRLLILRSLFGEGGAGGGGGLLGLFGANGAAVGGNAIGGPLGSGETTVVGERGPELFTAPQGGGRVTRNEDVSQLGLRPTVNVRIINVASMDEAAAASETSDENEEVILNVIQKHAGEIREFIT